MLVLNRKLGEEIVIDNNIRVTVVGIRGNQVRLGISAPPEVPIHRAELEGFVPRETHPDLCVAVR